MYHEERATLLRPRYGSIVDDERLSAEEMDERRRQNIAYEYLCHLEEAKRWMEACLDEELPPTTELEEGLRNGVYLGKLAKFFAPKNVSEKKIYDRDQSRYKRTGLHFRHTDNTVQWLRAMESVGLPKIFYPETTDVYDRKNMPKVIYCIHALSLYLYKLGIAPQIQDLLGKVDFTEEEISNMRRELEKYGIQMPAFSKIGGILANELSVDQAALHAAIIAINEAIDRGQAEATMKALSNPNAMLRNILDSLSQEYQDTLSVTKKDKDDRASGTQSSVESEERDVYEELLTQSEIQNSIDAVNIRAALQQVNLAIAAQDEAFIMASLKAPALGLLGVLDANSRWYLEHFTSYREHKVKGGSAMVQLQRDEIQQVVSSCNDLAEAEKRKLEAVTAINEAIRRGNSTETVEELRNPEAQLPIVYQNAASLYQSELFTLQRQNPRLYLEHTELSVAVEMLSAVAVLNEVLDTKDPQAVMEQLSDSPLGFSNLDSDNLRRYSDRLITLKPDAVAKGQDFLTWNDIQACIDAVNVQVHEEHDLILAINEINEALDAGEPEKTLSALLLPTAKLQGVNPSLAKHYHDVLQDAKDSIRKSSRDDSAVLWLDQIQDGVSTANKDEEDAFKLAEAVTAINREVSGGDIQGCLQTLQCPHAGLKGVLPECAPTYYSDLAQRQTLNADEGVNKSMWVKHRLRDRYYYYYNLESKQGTWVEPKGFVHDNTQLTREEIQGIVGSVTAEYNREQLWLAHEPLIVQLQARVRGYLVRKAHNERLEYLQTQEPKVIRLQASWKGYKQRKSYKDRLRVLQDNVGAVVKIQSWVKMWKARRKYSKRLQYFKDHEKEIVKIQAFLKANKARDDYRTLTGAENPPLSVVRKFVHLLEQSPLDLQEELDVTHLREEVVTKIRSNQQMERDLNLMDIKIGLLVKNRITLQDVVSHNKKLTNKKNKDSKDEIPTGGKQGIKGLSKEKRKKLEAYQHLFYLLQTNPTYLAKLIFQMPQNKSTKFMDTVIFTLYNFASNQREEYLLLKLFKTALEEEIKSKVDQIQDIVTGNPTVIKMVVSFNRGARGQNALRQLLAPVVKEIIEDKSLAINTNPVDVYKAWVNQLETATGEASKLPYEVTPEQAVSHEEVRAKLEASNQSLRVATDKVLSSIVSSLDNIPYGMRYIAKVLKNSLHEKFPDATEDELLKIVGNLLYYRYMNPAIVAPDGFDIIDMTAGGQLHSDQRRNLGSVAKVLQHAAANKLFEGENAHMTSMNSFISQTYQKFRTFFQAACDVLEPEEKFNVDEYSDMVTLSKPVIYISIEEIINTHSLVLEHQEAISPDRNDVLHELLEDLGDVPDIESLLGEGAVDPNDPNKESTLSQLAKTEVSLTLTSKFELLDGDAQDMRTLMMKTKKLIVDVVRIQPGETLVEILETPATALQEAEHVKIIEKRAAQDTKMPDGMKSSPSVLEDQQLPLEQKKRKILRNLRTLEQAGLVSSENKYQEIINDISKDIRYQRRYRQRRKAELVKLQQTLSALNSKTTFYQDQINYYDTYIKTCLDNLNRKNARRSIKLDKKGEDRSSRKSKQQSLKYTAARLHEKGVILEIEGLQTNQFKNVMFDISPSEEVGDFEVKAKFMGVEMEKVQVHFQDLLQLQYEGVAVMKMFDKAKVNVNLLIFLLNKKFYGK
ncbi:ras GTPase-activating-like protein IQGAP2 isoform X1 [Scleropages formosus]|uniref:IQ motif containing GTPase activating protein 2 n=1 Tax=Scleropages formosus TaxID=113540 RepID=A0A8C9V8W5_SCLFO|nr:ras GTPase-activating-like protein IQGAP1 isoform X1 [Scleropages formosus]XP_018613917.2 ras GTPase-activating-like protein IQGAP1 isoform X1 [Scleropages formosus]